SSWLPHVAPSERLHKVPIKRWEFIGRFAYSAQAPNATKCQIPSFPFFLVRSVPRKVAPLSELSGWFQAARSVDDPAEPRSRFQAPQFSSLPEVTALG